jgi:signal transduction histidine kinase
VLATGAFVLVAHYVHIAAGAPFEFLVLETSFALLFLVAGTVAWQRRPTSWTGPILVLSAALWTLGSFGPTGIAPFWAIGYAFEGYYDVALAFLALTFPADRLGGPARLAWGALLLGFVLRSLGRLLLTDPPRTYPDLFPDGPTNPFAVLESRAAFEAVELATSILVLVAVLVAAVLIVRRLIGSRSLARAVVGPVLVASVIAMGFAAVEAFDSAFVAATGASLVEVPEHLELVAGWLVPAGRAAVPLAFLLGTMRLRASGGPLSALSARLAAGDRPEETEAALAAYIENPELAELLTTQLAELRASRARIVAAGDAERARIERALHDGAQQHLTGIAMRLDEARRVPAVDPELARRLEAAAADLRDATNELRELARGIHPAVLTETGLEPALATLARRSAVPVDLGVDVVGRLPTPTEVTAYYVVAEGLTNVARHAHATRAAVRVERRADGLTVTVRDDGIGGADSRGGSGITGLRDRVRALGGRLRLHSPRGQGTDLEVWLPCE